MNPLDIQAREAFKTAMARRAFLGTAGVGAAALSLLERKSLAAAIDPARAGTGGGRVHPALPGFPHHAPKAKPRQHRDSHAAAFRRVEGAVVGAAMVSRQGCWRL